jgi:pimeloyl-ACP methyl ester carboxylesterase
MTAAALDRVEVDGLGIAYRELGSGPPVLLLHGWPTSSYLWREVMLPIAAHNRVLAIDLPGFGASDKPLGVRYDFELFDRTLDGFLAALRVETVGLAVHDLGGPIGLHWAVRHPERVTRLAILNTLVYPEFSEAVLQFIKACSTPELREQLTSPAGLAAAMGLGLADEGNLSDEMLAAVREPFQTEESRRALADAGIGLEPEGFAEIARLLPSLDMPVRVIYGERDRILPDVAETMARVKADLPQAEVTALPECGHFLQEEAPAEIGSLLAGFFRA